LTSGNATGSDGGGAQNDPNSSLGGWRSTTELSASNDNLFSKYTEAQLLSSVRRRCVAIKAETASDTITACRILADGLSGYPSSLSVEFGIQTNDNSTVAPVMADESTDPTGITFFSPYDSTAVPATDYPLSRKLAPLNSPGDNSADLDLTPDNRIVFIYIRITATAVSVPDWNNEEVKTFSANVIG